MDVQDRGVWVTAQPLSQIDINLAGGRVELSSRAPELVEQLSERSAGERSATIGQSDLTARLVRPSFGDFDRDVPQVRSFSGR